MTEPTFEELEAKLAELEAKQRGGGERQGRCQRLRKIIPTENRRSATH
jgi:hypothetical protein